ncbi:MAG TPA: hypothetical protein VFZ78_02000, partial [Flavisolibacter sp.]
DLFPYLRLIHIVAATFWVGANLFMAFFLYPALQVSGPSGNLFVQNVAGTHKLPVWMSLSSLLTILSGIALIYVISGGFSSLFFRSNYGIGILAGSVLAFYAFLHGFIVIRPRGERLAAIGKHVASGRESLTPELAEEIRQLNLKIGTSTGKEAWLLLVALVLMVMSKYI